MTDLTNPPEPDATPSTASAESGQDGGALDRAAQSIRDAREAEASVATHDDITTFDDERAGQYSEDPGGEGGHP